MLASEALGCAWQMINNFDQILLGAGMVPLGVAVLSLVVGIPPEPGSCAVHTTGATSPGRGQRHKLSACPCQPREQTLGVGTKPRTPP